MKRSKCCSKKAVLRLFVRSVRTLVPEAPHKSPSAALACFEFPCVCSTRVQRLADEFAVPIDEDLERLIEPGADRETLVGRFTSTALHPGYSHNLYGR